MNRRQVTRWMIATALFVFACSPVLSPQVISTLDPASLNTAIAGTAAAAAAGTAISAPGLQPVVTSPPSGEVLDPLQVNTVIAQTAAAAGTQTAALIPPSLTPSVTPLPSQTPSITPTASPTFIFKVPTWTKTSRPIATKTAKGGGGGGGGGGRTPHRKPVYSCGVVNLYSNPGLILAPNEPFQVVWRVTNTGDDWPAKSADLVFISGSSMFSQLRYDIPERVNTGDTINLPIVSMLAPPVSGGFSALWKIQIGNHVFCDMPLAVSVP